MKKLKKQYMAFLLISGTLFLSACGSLESEVTDPIPYLSEQDFQVVTLPPEKVDNSVMLKGTFRMNQPNVGQELVWGFLWMKQGENRSEDLRRINAGRGFSAQEFRRLVGHLPKDEGLIICAFVEARLEGAEEATVITGEEVDFAF